MTYRAIDALRADRDALLALCEGLSEADWKEPSGCAGWSVHDLVAHLGSLFWLVVDPSVLPDTADLPTEQAQDRCVEVRRDWSSRRVLEDYEAVSAQALDSLVGIESQDFELPLGDLGTYHASVLPNAYTFDHYTHIRADLCAPRGPLASPPPSDELRLAPTIDWIANAAPQQNATALASIDGSIEIDVVGTAARTFLLGEGDPIARVACSGHDLVLWSTQRADWDDVGIQTSGDDGALAVARELHVF